MAWEPRCSGEGAEIIFDATEHLDINYDTGSNVSSGTTTTVEAKIQTTTKYFPQVAATCVVSEETLHNNSMVPCILIDLQKFRVCFYDCDSDILLLSRPISLVSEKSTLSQSGVLLLWLTINHR